MTYKETKAFIKDMIFRFKDDEVTSLGSQLAYNLLLAFFPFLIFLVAVIGFSSLKSDDVLAGLRNLLPNDVFKLTYRTVIEVVDTKSTSLLSFGIIGAVWTASSGFSAVIRGLNKAYDESENRPFWKVQIITILCTIGLALMIICAFVLLVFGEMVVKMVILSLKLSRGAEILLDFFRFMMMILIMIFIFAIIYRYTPCRRLKWKEVLPGAVFTTLCWIILSIGFSYYVNHFGNYSRLYGSIGAVIALMTWLFLSSVIILIGGEINASLVFHRENRKRQKGKRYSKGIP